MGCPKLTILDSAKPFLKVTRKNSAQKNTRIVNFQKPNKMGLDYYPFGMQMPGRSGGQNDYRYSFQGQEKDDEVKGNGNSVNYKYRMHDPRLGRFFAVDPLTSIYPDYTPYSFSGNKVIAYVELEGLEEFSSYEAYKLHSEKAKLKALTRPRLTLVLVLALA